MLVGKTRRQKACQFYGQEHPCVRGESWVARSTPWRQNGTSPRTRGKLDGIALVPDLLRNIPAYAGKRCGLHSRGPGVGNIPAHAGKTQSPWPYRHPSKEHPRARGETCSQLYPRSSRTEHPRARGENPRCLPRGSERQWNIPAHAGKTEGILAATRSCAEHPRARGENLTDFAARSGETGTSPRTRGKHSVGLALAKRLRNIPAHAGKTSATPSRNLPNAEHPRVRGENSGMGLVRRLKRGTSPRARGKRCGCTQRSCGTGNIPACAGKTPVMFC